jgi:hypothetical protein
MINPRSLIRAIDKHWEAIERIVALGREQITHERDTLLALLAMVYVQDSHEQQAERLQSMVNAELLIPMPRSNTLQLNENVRQFVGSLLHEHELGLSEILKARIVDIRTGLEQLQRNLITTAAEFGFTLIFASPEPQITARYCVPIATSNGKNHISRLNWQILENLTGGR